MVANKSVKYYLIVSPQDNNDLTLSIIGPSGLIRSRVYRQGWSSERMVKSLDDFLTNSSYRLGGLVLQPMVGGFMRQRSAAVVINSLSYALKVPALAAAGVLLDYKFLQGRFSRLRRDNLIKIAYARPAV